MVSPEPSGAYMAQNGSIWVCMPPYGSIQVCMANMASRHGQHWHKMDEISRLETRKSRLGEGLFSFHRKILSPT